MSMNPALDKALQILNAKNFEFDNLPNERNDPIWDKLRKPPYNLSLQQISALKNEKCMSIKMT
jgi:hypothetical protein